MATTTGGAAPSQVLVTGGGTLLGLTLAAALLAEGSRVTLLLRPGTEDRLGPLASRVRWFVADMWDPASLRGRARGNQVVIHTVGSMSAEPARGLTHHRLNVVSARNAVNMCISDGVRYMVLLSAANAPWVNQRYIRAKREAEAYPLRVGLQSAVIRAPLLYVRGQPRPLFYRLMTLLGHVPPLSWLGLRRMAPMPMDTFARGVARVALAPPGNQRLYYARDLYRRNRRGEAAISMDNLLADEGQPTNPYQLLDDEAPFGWVPPDHDR